MNRLYQVKEKGQKVAEAIATVLNVEVEIVDEDLVRVAGTGRVKENIGSRMLRGLVNKRVIETGEYLYISSPGHHEICKKCTLAGKCFYKAYIVYPVKVKDEVIGNISLIAFNREQEENLRKQRESLVEFVSRMADFISSKVIEKQMSADRAVMANRLEAILDSVHEGVMAIDKAG